MAERRTYTQISFLWKWDKKVHMEEQWLSQEWGYNGACHLIDHLVYIKDTKKHFSRYKIYKHPQWCKSADVIHK